MSEIESDLDEATRQLIEYLKTQEFRKQLEVGTKLLKKTRQLRGHIEPELDDELVLQREARPQREIIKNILMTTESVAEAAIELMKRDFDTHEMIEAFNELKAKYENKDKNVTPTIPFRIIEEPLTPQNVVLILTALTELTTKLWLIAKHRFADLIEYTQTHDVRFANEAGSTIAWATYNSPFSFAFQVDKLVPGVAEAVMTVVDGLTQRKVHLEQLELENQAAAQKIKEAEQKLKQQQEMVAIKREKQELELEKQKLEIERERLTLVAQRLEMQKKQIEDALELAGKAVDIVYPNADADIRLILIQTVLNNILQLQSATGLELILPKNKDDDSSKEEVEQTEDAVPKVV